MRTLLTLASLLIMICMVNAQMHKPLEIKPAGDYDNIWISPLHSDTLCSTFLIYIKKSVKPHYHAKHTEVVHVLSGKAYFTLNDSTFRIKKNDLLIIPKGSVHSVKVKGRKPLIITSNQSPKFIGKDRIYLP